MHAGQGIKETGKSGSSTKCKKRFGIKCFARINECSGNRTCSLIGALGLWIWGVDIVYPRVCVYCCAFIFTHLIWIRTGKATKGTGKLPSKVMRPISQWWYHWWSKYTWLRNYHTNVYQSVVQRLSSNVTISRSKYRFPVTNPSLFAQEKMKKNASNHEKQSQREDSSSNHVRDLLIWFDPDPMRQPNALFAS